MKTFQKEDLLKRNQEAALPRIVLEDGKVVKEQTKCSRCKIIFERIKGTLFHLCSSCRRPHGGLF